MEQGAGRRRELGAGRRQLRPRRQPVRPRTEGHAGRQRGDEHLQGDQRRGGGSLNEIAELFEFVSGSVDEILETSPDLFQVRKRRTTSSAFRRPCWTRPRNWPTASRTWAGGRSINLFAGYALGALALASIILIGLVMVRETNRRLAETAEKNDRNQAAILRAARRDRRPRGRRPDRGRDRDRGLHPAPSPTRSTTPSTSSANWWRPSTRPPCRWPQRPRKPSPPRCTWPKPPSTRRRKSPAPRRRSTKWRCRSTRYRRTPRNPRR
ncbi:hypothetical protein ACPA9J_17405 [Pseudomonas aeruginosa]